jgi:hypothetical protein
MIFDAATVVQNCNVVTILWSLGGEKVKLEKLRLHRTAVQCNSVSKYTPSIIGHGIEFSSPLSVSAPSNGLLMNGGMFILMNDTLSFYAFR